jgi:hypothetical protein
MWVFTIYGFYSIACADQAGRGRKIDPDTIMVRARTKQHLQNLKERFVFMLVDGTFAIEDRKDTDYRFRILMPKATWVKMLIVLAEEQTWRNFKDEASKTARLNGWSHKYVDALHKVWDIMHSLQPAPAVSEDHCSHCGMEYQMCRCPVYGGRKHGR